MRSNPRRILAALLLCAPCLAAATLVAAPRAFTFDDLAGIDRLVDVALSPAGDQVALVTERHVNWGDRSSRLWLVSVRDRTRRVLDPGSAQSMPSQPQWSPDGSALAYLARRDKRMALQVVRPATAEDVPMPAVCREAEAQVAAWSPSGRQIAVLCQQSAPPPADEGDVIIASRSRLFNPAAPAPSGQTIDVVDLAAGRVDTIPLDKIRVTRHSKYRLELVWDAAGTAVWFTGTTTDNTREQMSGQFIYAADVRARTVRQVTKDPMPVYGLAFSPDGGELIVPVNESLINPAAFWRYQPFILWRGRPDGTGRAVVDRSDVYPAPALPARWTGAANGAGVVYYGLFERASYRLYAFDPATGSQTPVTPADRHITAYSVSADGRTMALLMGDANTPTEVYLFRPGKNAAPPEPLTRFGDDLRARHPIAAVEARWWKSADGRFQVHGFLMKPPGFEKGKRYPLITSVHGGPGAAWTNCFERIHFEDGGTQVPPELYAANGYLVLMVNPRADMSYGPEYMAAILEGWEYPTRYDIFAGIDDVIRTGEADPDRLGIAGASYGGWVSTFAVTQTDRFKAASAHDPVIDQAIHAPFAYQGENNGGNYYFVSNFFGGPPGVGKYPIVDPAKVKTPMLLRFGMTSGMPNRLSAFYASGLPYFVHLDTHGVPVEMILHPKDGHGIMTSDRIRDYNARNLAWFNYWLKGEPYPDAERQREFDAWRNGRTRGTGQQP